MTKPEIIDILSKNDKIKKAAKNIGREYGDDLYQHLFLVLLEYPDEKIIKAHEKNYTDLLCIRIMHNSYHSLSSPFAKQYRQHIIDESANDINLITNPEIEEQEIENKLCEECRIAPIEAYLGQHITQENFYNLTLVKRWAGGESYRKISKDTGIPLNSVAFAIRKAKEEIKSMIP